MRMLRRYDDGRRLIEVTKVCLQPLPLVENPRCDDGLGLLLEFRVSREEGDLYLNRSEVRQPMGDGSLAR